jgi:hypothetical protein
VLFEYDCGIEEDEEIGEETQRRVNVTEQRHVQIDDYLEKMSAMESEENEVGDVAHWEREMRLGGEKEGVRENEESVETRKDRYMCRPRVRRAERLVEAQHLSRASRLLRSTDGVAPPSAELNETEATGEVPTSAERCSYRRSYPTPRRCTYMCILEQEVFVRAVKRSINGASGGRSRSALTGDHVHVRPLLDNIDAMRELQRVVTLLINERFPNWAHPYLFSMCLIALGWV